MKQRSSVSGSPSLWRRFRSLPGTFQAGVWILLFFFLVAVFAPWLCPYSPTQIGPGYLRPSAEHWLGTNDVGQDILSELIYGTRVSLCVGIAAALIITCVGTLLGLMAGYFGGITDKIICALIDATMALPSLPLAFVLAAFLPSGLTSVLASICITSWASTARIVRTKAMQLRTMPFVLASRAMGISGLRIMLVQIFPNLRDLVFTKGTLAVSSAMLMESSLSFLGLGLTTAKSWGKVLQYAMNRNGVINGLWWWYVPPIMSISLCVMGFMLICYRREEKA